MTVSYSNYSKCLIRLVVWKFQDVLKLSNFFSEFDKAAEMLIQKGADLNIISADGNTVLTDAKERGGKQSFG